MTTITIPKAFAAKDDLVVLPRKEYEHLVALNIKTVKTFTPTKSEMQAAKRAEKNFRAGKTLRYEMDQDEALAQVLRARQEIKEGKGIKGDLRKILKEFKN